MTQTALYRACAADGALLYVGVTNDTRARWKQHAKDKPWWSLVDYVDYRWFSTRPEAELAEQFTIARECPPHNRNMPPWRAPMPTELVDAWRESFDSVAELVFDALAGGASLDAVAEAADWHPRYIVRLGLQRHVPWASEYVARIRDGKVTPS